MKYAICMLVHNKPVLLERIVSKLHCGQTQIFVHLDAKCTLTQYTHIPHVTFIRKRVHVHWGGRNMATAMYNLIEHVVRNTDCDYILFISGQDFPIVHPGEYSRYIDASRNYLEYEMLPKKDWPEGGIERIKYYYLFRSPLSLGSRALVKLQKILGFSRKVSNLGFTFYGGSQWININRKAGEYVLSHWKQYYRIIRFCNIPDELIFQTIIMNSPLRDTVVNSNFRYLTYIGNQPNPAYLDARDIDSIARSKVLLCRKVLDESAFDRLNLGFLQLQHSINRGEDLEAIHKRDCTHL